MNRKDLRSICSGESVDMRKQMNGLIALVEGTYHMDPFEKALFLFTNKKKDKIKALAKMI